MIAVDGMFGPFDDCLANEVGRLKVHIGHPHRQHIGVVEHLFSQIILNAVGISAVDNLVEIVFHCHWV